MKISSIVAFLGLVAVVVGLAGACGGDSPKCDPKKCAARNVCIDDQCMLPCASYADCPTGYDCKPQGDQNVCVANHLPTGRGTFGTPCGTNGDPDCDASRGFVCFGKKDVLDSYCSRYDCSSDADCPGQYYCDKIVKPGTQTLAFGCLQRRYCAPCEQSLDCVDEDAQCVSDQAGVKSCLKSCDPLAATGKQCLGGSACFSTGRCFPLQGACKGNGDFCSSCRSGADCASGRCYRNSYTKESFCLVACDSNGKCLASPGGVQAVCDSGPTGSNYCFPTGGIPIAKITDATQIRCWP